MALAGAGSFGGQNERVMYAWLRKIEIDNVEKEWGRHTIGGVGVWMQERLREGVDENLARSRIKGSESNLECCIACIGRMGELKERKLRLPRKKGGRTKG